MNRYQIRKKINRCKVLCYHRVTTLTDDYNFLAVSPQNFEEQISYLKSKYSFFSLNDSWETIVNNKRDAVALSFDDGYYDLLYEMLPLIEKYGIPVTVFIATENMGKQKENWTDSILRAIFQYKEYHDTFAIDDSLISMRWNTGSLQERVEFYEKIRKIFLHISPDKRNKYERNLLKWAGLSETDGRQNRRMLNEEELKRLSENPLISIGAHSVSHSSLKAMTYNEQLNEIAQSKKTLESIIMRDISLFAYPFGTLQDFSEDTIKILKECGFSKAVTTIPGRVNTQTDPYRIPRYIVRNYNLNDFCDFMEECMVDNISSKVARGGVNCSSICYIGKLKDDCYVYDSNTPLIIWGAGFCGKQIFENLKQINLSDRVIAFGDNDVRKQGKVFLKRPVIGMSDLSRRKEHEIIVLVKSQYDWEICKELAERGISNIHLIE